MSSTTRRPPVVRHATRNPLEAHGWKATRAGRWIDPVTGRSHTTMEAWDIIGARGGEKV